MTKLTLTPENKKEILHHLAVAEQYISCFDLGDNDALQAEIMGTTFKVKRLPTT